MDLKGKSILVTGGTGSFGKKLIEVALAEHQPHRIVVYSRDELKQFEMQTSPRFSGDDTNIHCARNVIDCAERLDLISHVY